MNTTNTQNASMKQNDGYMAIIMSLILSFLISSGYISADVAQTLMPMKPQESKDSESSCHYLLGIRGLADYLGISLPCAQKLKNSGKLDLAIRRVGRNIRFVPELVDEAMRKG